LISIAGASAALSAAILWAFSAILFEDIARKIAPARLNLLKGAIAIVLLAGTSVILGEAIPAVSKSEIAVLMISGVIGIAIGDTAYFQSVQKIGARRALTLFTLAPPMAALIALVFLGERLPLITWIGILLTAGGVMWVVTENTHAEKVKIAKENLTAGILFGAFAALCQAAGVVMTRSVLTDTALTTLQSTIVRLLPALLALLVIIRLTPNRLAQREVLRGNKKLWKMVFLSSIIGAYICLWLQQLAIENMPAGIAQTILSTSPIFILPMMLLRGEKVSLRATVGAAVAIFGVTLVFGLIG
jgi:drug/metabolite transporter (DMT)-like permease